MNGVNDVVNPAAEIEFLNLLKKNCRAVRNPRNAGNRLELCIPAAKWEMIIERALAELEQSVKKAA